MKNNNNIKFETLRKSYIKPIVIGLVVFIVVMSVLILKGSMAKYVYKQSVKLAEGTINYKMPDFNLIALNIQDENGEYQSASEVPESGYTVNSELSYCYKLNGDESKSTYDDITIEYKNGKLNFLNVSENGTKCYVYLDIGEGTIIQDIIANKIISSRSDFSTLMTGDTTGFIYSAEDDDGTTYYFAGAPNDNYVYFAGFYWRIIRVNGDGSIRLIYDGTSPIANGMSESSSQIGTSSFNPKGTDNMYVGFMYTSGSVHGFGTSSTIKGVLDDWYSSNLASYAEFLDTNAGFCGDRTSSTNSSVEPNDTGGTGSTTTYYGAFYRLSSQPNYKCTYSEDLYTISTSSKGNKALTNPIGLITMDEAFFAGLSNVQSINTSYYLYTGNDYWTMSPNQLNKNANGYVYIVGSSGRIAYTYVGSGYSSGVRPVINLKSSTKFTGSGLANDPFVVVGA